MSELLAHVAAKTGIAIGIGGRRAAPRDPSRSATYSVVRENAPHAFVIPNVGILQLVKQHGEGALAVKDIEKIVMMESVQPERPTRAKGSDAAALTRGSPVPVIATETGAGITLAVARRLRREAHLPGAGVLIAGGSLARLEQRAYRRRVAERRGGS